LGFNSFLTVMAEHVDLTIAKAEIKSRSVLLVDWRVLAGDCGRREFAAAAITQPLRFPKCLAPTAYKIV
jgi:hypothetical protein